MKPFRTIIYLGLLVLAVTGPVLAQSNGQDHKRNYRRCLYGSYLCERSRLTASERKEVAQADYKRNYRRCLYGSYLCERSRLTASERKEVAQADYKRNYRRCLYGSYLCERSRLTASERKEVAQAEPARKATGSGLPVIAPVCAENGSCYGDISEATGRPKTVRVRGYYRKDGTYVRGHYRSKPRRRN